MLSADTLDRAIDLLVGAGGGVVAAIVTLRTRFAIQDLHARRIAGRLDAIERQQLAALRLMADIARKLNLDHRFSDTLIRFLADEQNNSRGE